MRAKPADSFEYPAGEVEGVTDEHEEGPFDLLFPVVGPVGAIQLLLQAADDL